VFFTISSAVMARQRPPYPEGDIPYFIEYIPGHEYKPGIVVYVLIESDRSAPPVRH